MGIKLMGFVVKSEKSKVKRVANASPLPYGRRSPRVSRKENHYSFTVGSLYVHGRFTEAPLGLTKGWLGSSSYPPPIKSVLTACF